MAKLKVKKGLEANLPAVEDGSLLITTDSKKLYLDNGEERIQVGEVGGVTVDVAMSDTSVNPVQNKVIKAYVDSLIIDDGSID